MKTKDIVPIIFVSINIGDIVVLKTDKEKNKRICTGISIRKDGATYELTKGDTASWHYSFEVEHEEKYSIVGFKKANTTDE